METGSMSKAADGKTRRDQPRSNDEGTLAADSQSVNRVFALTLTAKNGKAIDVKKAATGDNPERNGNWTSEKAKDVKIQTFTPAKTKLVKRGFVKMFVDFVVKRGSATTDDLAAEFAGRERPQV